MRIVVLRGNLQKTQGTHAVLWEPIENITKTLVLRQNLLKQQCKDNSGFALEFITKRKENNSAAWEPMENVKKTMVLRGNPLKTK